MRGSPWWPARVDFVRSSKCPSRHQGPHLLAKPDFRHPVFFFGTHEICWIKYKDLRPFDPEKALEESKSFTKKRQSKLKLAIMEAWLTPCIKLQFDPGHRAHKKNLTKRFIARSQEWLDGETEVVDKENEDWRALTRSTGDQKMLELHPEDGRERA